MNFEKIYQLSEGILTGDFDDSISERDTWPLRAKFQQGDKVVTDSGYIGIIERVIKKTGRGESTEIIYSVGLPCHEMDLRKISD